MTFFELGKIYKFKHAMSRNALSDDYVEVIATPIRRIASVIDYKPSIEFVFMVIVILESNKVETYQKNDITPRWYYIWCWDIEELSEKELIMEML